MHLAGEWPTGLPGKRLGLPRIGPDLVIGLVAVLVTGATFATVAERSAPQPDEARAPEPASSRRPS
ncbi:hypothetical protein [Nocardioides alcanivorans]|uniref:hypothetical protein n=1 Tax=Nocardioides alcanivorans TaxID=2897352 RepID=UPI001F3431BD|nr:hypothetical protein [Nocardioides alcanivorans]